MQTRDYLEQLPFWEALAEQQRDRLVASAQLRNVEADTMIYGLGESSIGMMHVVSGEIRAYILSEEGREVTLYRLLPGDNCVLSASGAIGQAGFDTYMTAQQPSALLVIPAAEYEDMVEHSVHVRCYTYELAAQRLSVILWILHQILFSRFDERLASFFMEEYRRTGCREICMTQEQIAGYVNSAREVVARMLRRFASDGLIENRRGAIYLLDMEGIAELASSIVPLEEITN